MIASTWSYRRVGDFEIEERIGRGGSASVFRARQVPVNRYVALKIIDLDSQANALAFKRFQQEAHVVASLEHLHILPIYDYGVIEDQHAYFVTRLMHRSLSDMLRHGPLPIPTAARVFLQIGSALAYAHSRGVTHRDIKPSNILLDETGNAYLSDFGLARRDSPAHLISEEESGIIGTPSYIAPEILLGQPADHLSDIYSFGVVLYHMLTGRVPFEISSSLNIASLFYKHVQQAPTPPRELRPAIPPAIEQVILRALAKNPQERYLTVNDMLTDFQAAFNLQGLSFTVPAARRLPIQPRFALVLAILAALMVSILYNAYRLTDINVLDDHIRSGTTGVISDVTPTNDEIGRARTTLGDDGYIAYLACGLHSSWQSTRARELSQIADELGLPLRVFDAQGDMYTQSTQIETAQIEGAQAIILCPLDSELAGDMGRSLAERAIPLVYSLPVDHPYGVKLGSSELTRGEAGARLMVYAIVQLLAGGSVPEVLTLGDAPPAPLDDEPPRSDLAQATPTTS